jgi:hypothetical protein
MPQKTEADWGTQVQQGFLRATPYPWIGVAPANANDVGWQRADVDGTNGWYPTIVCGTDKRPDYSGNPVYEMYRGVFRQNIFADAITYNWSTSEYENMTWEQRRDNGYYGININTTRAQYRDKCGLSIKLTGNDNWVGLWGWSWGWWSDGSNGPEKSYFWGERYDRGRRGFQVFYTARDFDSNNYLYSDGPDISDWTNIGSPATNPIYGPIPTLKYHKQRMWTDMGYSDGHWDMLNPTMWVPLINKQYLNTTGSTSFIVIPINESTQPYGAYWNMQHTVGESHDGMEHGFNQSGMYIDIGPPSGLTVNWLKGIGGSGVGGVKNKGSSS